MAVIAGRLQEQFDIFLSHNSRDKQLIDPIVQRLYDEYDIRSWLDKWDLHASAEWEPAIRHALESCRICAVVLGANGWGPHHLNEARFALLRKAKDPEYQVIPVLLPGADQDAMAVLGDFFQRTHRVDFSNGVADEEAFLRLLSAIRGEAPGPPPLTVFSINRAARQWDQAAIGDRTSILYRGGELRSAQAIAVSHAAMLSDAAVKFLSMSAEEEQRNVQVERKRTRKIIASLAVGLIIVAVTAVFAFAQRFQAVKSANLAEERRKDAEIQKGIADAQKDIAENKRIEAELQKRIADEERGRADLKTQEALASAEAERIARIEEQLQRQEAVRQRAEAIRQLDIARSGELAALALSKLSSDPELSLLLAKEAIDTSRTKQAEEALKKSLALSNIVAVMREHSGGVLEGSLIDNHVLTTGLDRKARVWNLKSRDSSAYPADDLVLEVDTKVPPSASISSDGRYFVTINKGTGISHAIVREISSGRVIKHLTGPEQIVTTSFSNNGSVLATAGIGPDNSVTIRSWDVNTWTGLSEFKQIMNAPGLLPAVKVIISNDGNYIATLGQGLFEFRHATSQVLLVNRNSSKLVGAIRVPMRDYWDYPGRINAISFSPKSDLLALASADGATRLYSTRSGELVGKLCGSQGSVNDVGFSPDGTLIVTTNHLGTVEIWRSPKTAKNDSDQPVDNDSNKDDDTRAQSDFFIPRLAETYSDCTVTNTINLTGHFGPVLRASFSSDGKYVATAGADKSARVWKAETGDLVAEFRGHQSWVNAVAFSRDNKFIITASNDGTARIWSTGINMGQVGAHEFLTPGPQGSTDSTTSNDGRYIMSMCCGGSSILLSDKWTGKNKTLEHPERVFMWKFNRAGTGALTSSGNIVMLWTQPLVKTNY